MIEAPDFPAVNVYLSVNDLDGHAITDLEQPDFAVYENDVPIPAFTIEPAEHPLLIGIVIDSAVSFNTRERGQPRVEHAKEAARWLVDPQTNRLTNPDDHVAVFAFKSGQPVRLVDFTYDLQMVLDQGINPVSTEGNQYTALFDILCQAIDETSTRSAARRRALLVFSDGVDRTSGIEVDRVIQEAVHANLLIYTVGLGSNLAPDRPDSAFLRRLADETGGDYIWYQPGRDGETEEMNALLDALVAQRHGYVLTYTSNQYEGTPEVRVTVRQGDSADDGTATFEVPPLAPVVTLDNVTSGEILMEVVAVQPSISRMQRDIDRVEYYIDDVLVYTANAAPWSFEWDTREYASSTTDADAHTIHIIACDIGQQCGETSLTLGTRLPEPTPTPQPAESVVQYVTETPAPWYQSIQLWVSAGALLIALGALITLLIFMRRNKIASVGGVVAEVRKRTRVWRQRTGIFSGEGAAPQQNCATLTITSDMFKDKQFKLQESAIFLGRDELRADIAFHWDELVSGRHAKISQEGIQFYIWDLNSTNGTWVNEQRVPRSLSEGMELGEAIALRSGDVVRLGPDLRARFHGPGDGIPAPAEPAQEKPTKSDAPTQILSAP